MGVGARHTLFPGHWHLALALPSKEPGCQFPDANLRCKRSFRPLSRAVRTVSHHGLLGEASSPGGIALAFAIPPDDVESRL